VEKKTRLKANETTQYLFFQTEFECLKLNDIELVK
jgi:hypothetical protein